MTESIKQTLLEIQLENTSSDQGIPREILKRPFTLAPDIVTAIRGVRRCGKSTLMRQMALALKRPVSFINFEDPRLSDHLDHRLLDVMVKVHEEANPKGPHYYFMDEVQSVDDWEKWLHVQLEKRGRQRHFIISGSNATLLGGKLGTALTGRHLDIELFPFSFSEYKLLKPSSTFDDYFLEGGFPRPLTHENGPALLREYFNDIIDRDVRRHVAARSSEALRQIAKAVFESTGSETSFRKLANCFDLTPDTVKTYLDGLAGAYLILPCPYFTYSERQRAVRPKKYYPIDLGLHTAVATKTGVDKGKKLETLVFHHLRKTYQEVHYWRGTKEVDLVVETRNGLQPIQVSWEGMKERHSMAANEFKEKFPKSLPVRSVDRNNIEKILTEKLSLTAKD